MTSFEVDTRNLPEGFPTHLHANEFWCALGKTVATFGFLEESLGKAIFALTATRQYDEDEIEEAFQDWRPKLERALVNPLSNLIDEYCKAARDYQQAMNDGFDELEKDLRSATVIRNALCHGSWRAPDAQGFSKALYVHKTRGVFDTPVDVTFLERTQLAVRDVACAVISSVTHLGLQFPGSDGPGKPILGG